MNLYRAIQHSKIGNGIIELSTQSTIRVPKNVPYVVDNLWEWLRPVQMPSRRHAIYASPSPELALANASTHLDTGERHIVCLVADLDLSKNRVAQISVSDARDHPDVKAVSNFLSEISSDITRTSLDEKSRFSAVFSPGLSACDLETLNKSNAIVNRICEFATSRLTLWGDASNHPIENNGEVYFELTDDSKCRLIPIG